MLAKMPPNGDVSAMNRDETDPAAGAPAPLSGAWRGAALVWVVAVIAVYLAVREFGFELVH